ncbi:hypothetical protein RhiJN_26441 [Ceratobasidium sp. AG-Ba]|nr:hypothetical protein RhiJN_26441 [Ceratobasidium sp. AG-Ba]
MSVSNEAKSSSPDHDDHHRQSKAPCAFLRRAGTTCDKSTRAWRTHVLSSLNGNIFGVLSVRYASSNSKDRKRSKESTTPIPKRPVHPQIRLIGRGSGVANFTPDRSLVRLDTSVPSQSTYPRPHYLTTEQARRIPEQAFTASRVDGYILARTVELFGVPGETEWVMELNEKNAPGVLNERVNDYLSQLEWIKPPTRALKDAAWAEHLIAMQNPRMEGELDEYEQSSAQVDAPSWPSSSSSNADPGLIWSTLGERDEPRATSSRTPAHLLGKHNFPRPKRIIRLRAYSKSLVLVFASSNARRAIMGAYAAWIRQKLISAYQDRDASESLLEGAPWKGVWPPIDGPEIGGLRKEEAEYQPIQAALNWADKSGWRPACRIRPFVGLRRWADEWHPNGKWSPAKTRTGGR